MRWQAEIGAGFSGVAVQGERVFAHGNLNDEDVVFCLDAASGLRVWTYRYPSRAMGSAQPDEPGPRATPLVQGNAVYTLSRDGRILCLDTTEGRLRWWRDVPAEIGERPPYWGFGGSPLVWEDLLIWTVGAHGLAVRAQDGKVMWKSEPRPSAVWSNEPVGVSGYSTPEVVEFGGQRLVSLSNESQWLLVDPASGTVAWATPWAVPYGVNAAQPAVVQGRVVLTGGYGYGTRVVRLGDDAGLVWENRLLRSHFSSVAVLDGFLYGIDGNQQDGARCELRCLDLDTGEMLWAHERFGFGNLVLVDGKVLIMTARGELVLMLPNPERYRETGRVHVLPGETWTAPHVAGNAVYARNKQGRLVRVDLPGDPR